MSEIKQIWCEEDKIFYPETKTENGRFYKLDPQTFVYLEQLDLGLTDEEQELMTENYLEVIPSLQGRLKWDLIPSTGGQGGIGVSDAFAETVREGESSPDRFCRVSQVGEHFGNVDRQSYNGGRCVDLSGMITEHTYKLKRRKTPSAFLGGDSKFCNK